MDGQAPPLPDDALAGILRRLAPRGLAACRCVCRAWRRVVDDRRLLRADLLPRSLGGIFLNLHDLWFTQFLCRPTTTGAAAVSGRLDYTVVSGEHDDRLPPIDVRDHCNGLLALRHCVVNPATRQWAPLPPRPNPEDMPQPPPAGMGVSTDEYLVFDPSLSPDFELLILPSVPYKLRDGEKCEESEWPPSTMTLSVFSSKSGSWDKRAFGREGEAAGMLPAMVASVKSFFNHQCGYWRGSLYVCCSDCFVMRISLSDNKYRVIKLPAEDGEFYLGKSIKGIYCASFFQGSRLDIWFLNDQYGHDRQTEWVLKHDRDIFPFLPNLNPDEYCGGPWNLQEFYYWEHDRHAYGDSDVDGVIVEDRVVEKFEWDSDNDNVLEPGSRSKDSYIVCLDFICTKRWFS